MKIFKIINSYFLTIKNIVLLLIAMFFVKAGHAQLPPAVNKLDIYNLAFDTSGIAWYTFLNHDSLKYYLGSYKNGQWDSSQIPLSVTGNKINDLKIDSHNTIWIACSKGFIKYNGSAFTSITLDTIKEFAFGKNDTIWGICKNKRDSIFKFNGSAFSYYPDTTFKDTVFREIAVGDSNHVFVYGQDSLYERGSKGWVNLDTVYPDLGHWKIRSNIVLDAGNNIWFIVRNYPSSAALLLELTNKALLYYSIDVSGTVYHSIDIDKTGKLRYINSAGNISTFSPSVSTPIQFLDDTNFPINSYSKIKVDKSNFVWIYKRNY